MFKKLILLILITSSLFCRSMEVIPANINFENKIENEIVEELYMMFHNGISSYNSIQNDSNQLINVKESFLPTKKYKKDITEFYKKNKIAYKEQYVFDNQLSFLLEYRVKHKDILLLKECKYLCKVDLQVYIFKIDSCFVKKNITVYYESNISSLSDESYDVIDQFIQDNLDL